MKALVVAQPHSAATDVTSRRSASSTRARCSRSWVRHRGKVIASSSRNRRLRVRWLTPIRWPICCNVNGSRRLSAINAHASRQPAVDGCGNPQRLTGASRLQLIVKHGQHPVVLVGVGRGGLRTRDDEFAHQGVDRQHGRCRGAATVAVRVQRDAVKLRAAVKLVFMPTARRYPDCPIGRRDPGPRRGGDRDRTRGRIDDLVQGMPVPLDPGSRRQRLRRRHQPMVAEFRHNTAEYRKPAVVTPA